ncbi:hypothetical protein JTB14_010631 [Gonioctena quinquepunctata]|nr:hypothetical protein JTB14_010631 [Gonioctena quinquepunctata]
MLANMEHLQARVEVWMDPEVGNAKISKARPALHAFTGYDINPALYRRGKKKPLQFLMNSEIFQEAFLDLGSKEHNVQDSFNIIQSFTCHLYGLKKLDDVNQARIVIFNKTFKSKTVPVGVEPLKCQCCEFCEEYIRALDHIKKGSYLQAA